MAKPVVTQPATPRAVAQGIAIPPLALVATHDPETWAASPLPQGLSLDAEAGVVTGTPTAAGLVSTTITATNADGTSDPVSLVWNVQAQPVGAGAWSDLELDFDVVERSVSIPGVERAEGVPLFRAARDDRFDLLVGVRKFGVLWDVSPDGEQVLVKLALKEFEPEIVLTLAGGMPTKVGAADATRYRIPVWLDPAAWAALADYERAQKTELTARAELELSVGSAVGYDESVEADGLTLRGGMGGAGYASPAALEETLVFTGLENEEGATYTLTVWLRVDGRPGQSVELQQTLRIAYLDGIWTVSDRDGLASVQGAPDGPQWRATLAIVDVAGDGDSVDVDVAVTTTSGVSAWTVAGAVENHAVGKRLRLYGGSGQLGDGYVFGIVYGDTEALLSAFQTAWFDLTGETVTASASGIDVVIAAPGDTAAAELVWEDEAWSGPGPGATPVGPDALVSSASILGRLVEAAGLENQPHRYTAQFAVGVMRDMVTRE